MVWLKRCLLGSALVALIIVVWLWLTMLSPWFYERPAHLPDIEQRSHQVFVYGTLRYAPVRWMVMYASGNPTKAILEGYERTNLDLATNQEAHVDGLLLEVTPYQLARLDRYERLGIRYERVKQTLADGTTAWVYVRLPSLSRLRLPSPDYQAALVP